MNVLVFFFKAPEVGNSALGGLGKPQINSLGEGSVAPSNFSMDALGHSTYCFLSRGTCQVPPFDYVLLNLGY